MEENIPEKDKRKGPTVKVDPDYALPREVSELCYSS